MKVSVLILGIFISFYASASDEITFAELFGFSVFKDLNQSIPEGKCFDVGSYFRRSVTFAGTKARTNEFDDAAKTKIEAQMFCKANKVNPMCNHLEEFIKLNKESQFHAEYDWRDFARYHLINSLTKNRFKSINDLFNYEKNMATSLSGCRETEEFRMKLKYGDVASAILMEGDNSLSSKMRHKYHSGLDDFEPGSISREMQDIEEHCSDEIKAASLELFSIYEDGVKSRCLNDIAKDGLSIYDQDKVYCGGKTPFACRFYKTKKAARRGMASLPRK